MLFLEPIHRSRLLRRILPMNVREWTLRCEERGLELRERGNLFFVPARYLLAFRDLPAAMCNPVFDIGERVLHASKAFDRLSDYKSPPVSEEDRPRSAHRRGPGAHGGALPAGDVLVVGTHSKEKGRGATREGRQARRRRWSPGQRARVRGRGVSRGAPESRAGYLSSCRASRPRAKADRYRRCSPPP